MHRLSNHLHSCSHHSRQSLQPPHTLKGPHKGHTAGSNLIKLAPNLAQDQLCRQRARAQDRRSARSPCAAGSLCHGDSGNRAGPGEQTPSPSSHPPPLKPRPAALRSPGEGAGAAGAPAHRIVMPTETRAEARGEIKLAAPRRGQRATLPKGRERCLVGSGPKLWSSSRRRGCVEPGFSVEILLFCRLVKICQRNLWPFPPGHGDSLPQVSVTQGRCTRQAEPRVGAERGLQPSPPSE